MNRKPGAYNYHGALFFALPDGLTIRCTCIGERADSYYSRGLAVHR